MKTPAVTGRETDRILDEYLLVLARSGGREAFAELVRRWTPRLLRYAGRTLGSPDSAADVVQEVWTGVARNLRGLDDPARFPGWIYGIATRKCADWVRRAALRRRSERRAVTDPALQTEPADALDRAGDALDLSGALARLPAAQRIVIDLFYLDGFGVEEIAAAIGVPAGTVKSRLHAARQTLKAHLKGVPHDPA